MIDPNATVWRFQQAAPVNLDGAAAALNIPVLYAPLPEKIAGKIKRRDDRFVITINSKHHPNRQRFTLAHELSHYLMHRDFIKKGVTDSTMYRSNLSNIYEIKANKRAADILMPADLMQKEWAKSTNVVALASKFGVSTQSMEIRIETLGLKRAPVEGSLFSTP